MPSTPRMRITARNRGERSVGVVVQDLALAAHFHSSGPSLWRLPFVNCQFYMGFRAEAVLRELVENGATSERYGESYISLRSVFNQSV